MGNTIQEREPNYLRWVKDLIVSLNIHEDRDQCCNLVLSNIHGSEELFLKHMREVSLQQCINTPNPWGHPDLIYKISFKAGTHTDNVLLTSGGSGGIFLICKGLIHPGDHVIVESPEYRPLRDVPEALGASVSLFYRKAENNYGIDAEQLGSMVTPETKLIFLTNLHNPSSTWLEDKHLIEILNSVKKRNNKTHIVIDEVYHDFMVKHQKSAALLDKTFISINSFSKVYGLEILRCGWILASPGIIDSLRKVYMIVENNGSVITESMASIVMDHLDEYDNHWKAVLKKHRTVLRNHLKPLLDQDFISGNIPEFGCIYFPRIIGFKSTDLFAEELAKQYRVFIAPGSFFNAPEHVRIGFGGDYKELCSGLEKFAAFIRHKKIVA